jgi:hypothetical protein
VRQAKGVSFDTSDILVASKLAVHGQGHEHPAPTHLPELRQRILWNTGILSGLYASPGSRWRGCFRRVFSSEDTVEPARRFEHYELVTREDSKSVESCRGAMGVTYKAFDVNLRCPVTLKVISERDGTLIPEAPHWLYSRFYPVRVARYAITIRV